jgi:hypothetical protein
MYLSLRTRDAIFKDRGESAKNPISLQATKSNVGVIFTLSFVFHPKDLNLRSINIMIFDSSHHLATTLVSHAQNDRQGSRS